MDIFYERYLQIRKDAETYLQVKSDMVSKPDIYTQKNIEDINIKMKELIDKFRYMETLIKTGNENEMKKYLNKFYPYSLQFLEGKSRNVSNNLAKDMETFTNRDMGRFTTNIKESTVKSFR
jgi:hypothetical protein